MGLAVSSRREAQVLGYMRRQKMKLKFKLTVGVRNATVWSFLMHLDTQPSSSLSWHMWP